MLFYQITSLIAFYVFLLSINVDIIGIFSFGLGLGMLFNYIDKSKKKDEIK